ncbi:hypothetical protein NEDG_00061 [Nematocida displodere]|uniref:Uncharacterized protein n=1 Tax=Nematocida displodere TaxID=1805483 RepID=A0A177EIN5_9MICR|nr:hypothetical protein NEDG_00061 [Nematocida displodere]
MNEHLLNLCEATLEEYTTSLIPAYENRKSELEVLITNMPQKHTLANYIGSELAKSLTPEKMLQEEAAILKASASNFFLFSNTLLYLERRWNTQIIKDVLTRSLGPEDSAQFMPLVIDPAEEEVETPVALEPMTLELPGISELAAIFASLEQLASLEAVSSARDAFTAYKISLVYITHPKLAIQELHRFMKMENTAIKEIVGGMLLGLSVHPEERMYYTGVLVKLCRKNKNAMQLVLHLFLAAYNTKHALWSVFVNSVPHLYLAFNEVERVGFSPLVYVLDEKNSVLLYELLDGQAPPSAVFIPSISGRGSLPAPRVRHWVRQLLHINDQETYDVSGPAPSQAPPANPTTNPTTNSTTTPNPPFEGAGREQMASNLEDFFSFFIEKTKLSFTHFNNTLLEHKDAFQNLSPEDLQRFLLMLLSSPNSLVYKELAVSRVYRLRH